MCHQFVTEPQGLTEKTPVRFGFQQHTQQWTGASSPDNKPLRWEGKFSTVFMQTGTAHIYLWVAEVLLIERSCLCYFLLSCTFREEDFCHLAGECQAFQADGSLPCVEEHSFSSAENTNVFSFKYLTMVAPASWVVEHNMTALLFFKSQHST